MSKFTAKSILLALTFFLTLSKGYSQPCLHCLGGSSDGYANDAVSNCPPPVTIFAGGIYTGFASSLAGTCSASSTIFASGGSFGGSSGAADGVCAAPVSVTIGGSYDGISGDMVSICAPPVSLMIGGDYDGGNGAFVYCDEVNPLTVQDRAGAFTVDLYPNPASGDFIVSFSDLPKEGRIVIDDVLGKEMVSEHIIPLKQQYTFKAIQWEEGVYFLRIVADGRQFTQQLLVIKNNK